MKIYSFIIVFSLLVLSGSKGFTQVTAARGYIAANTGDEVVQPYTISVLAGDETNNIELSYPTTSNRSTDFVTLTVQPSQYKNMSFRLFTIKGRVILEQELSFGQVNIMLPDYSSSLYMLSIYNNDKEVKSFKIIKNK